MDFLLCAILQTQKMNLKIYQKNKLYEPRVLGIIRDYYMKTECFEFKGACIYGFVINSDKIEGIYNKIVLAERKISINDIEYIELIIEYKKDSVFTKGKIYKDDCKVVREFRLKEGNILVSRMEHKRNMVTYLDESEIARFYYNKLRNNNSEII